MKSNLAMTKLLDDVTVTSLKPALRSIVDRGFDVREGCYFLGALLPTATNVTKSSFQDCTGYECFVNSLHIEDYDDNNLLSQAIQLASDIFAAWRADMPDLPLISIVSVDETSVVVKFHVKRPTEQWLSENLDGYEDPIMLMESSKDWSLASAKRD
ncbi:MAG: hypothetical protein GY734_14675 [Herbaspirillum sp.]|jgi:hypothetical protein|uniref:hypothetical protein n=2 Tax=Oxalobacteraceae TaxID=75682 RepID=UPI002585F9CD|nr:hypothetical protein [Herbaspirillum sp.]MCP3657429.1 hypothetical protein [Herbaspirillum sp.]MCP3946148.1 hypothetical protein [Herbaspirillum sp.]MCP4032464.1 hypothetical protein [Herbaspirillum sp.]MCP4558106.1 hypothetical protein [Herbaspirillum sp.]